MQECKNRAAGSLEWESAEAIENSMSEAEKREFEQVMGNPVMPDDGTPNYDAWLFHMAYQSRQPEIDALKAEIVALSNSLHNTTIAWDASLRQCYTLKAENEKLRNALIGLYQSDKALHEAPDVVERYAYESMLETHYRTHAEAGKLIDAVMTAPDTKGE